ncbi:hypothetical protein LPJ61_001654 [Coemansia biformis]|uniref:Uncharacterized protein n=1 Tax=Coemansia biformis TaxID=1286918 RepID=A0A9W7YFZ9_9FUNG|nr:hypothetical protein LPJ61_001654 [Coemansia biformis]
MLCSDSSSIRESANSQLLDQLGQNLPGVTKLDISIPRSANLSTLVGGMVLQYAGQLVHISLSNTLGLSPAPFSEQLSSLRIGSGALENSALRLPVDSLATLHLDNVSQRIPWSRFGQEMNASQVDFPSLRNLHISYNDEPLPASGPGALDARPECTPSFSRLETLVIRNLPSAATELRYSKFARKVDSIAITCNVVALAALTRFSLPVADSMHIGLRLDGTPSARQFLDSANHLFGGSGVRAQRLSLSLSGLLWLPAPAEDISWSNLSTLTVGSDITMGCILLLIPHLPASCQLNIRNFPAKYACFSQIPEEKLAPAPLHSKLTLVSFSYDTAKATKEQVLAFLGYLMVRVAPLPKLLLPSTLLTLVDDFVIDYMWTYPHLLDVGIVVY